jgi:outer membrane protein OmpA-like peptidoglycan-associated protein
MGKKSAPVFMYRAHWCLVAAILGISWGGDESCCERPILTKNGQRGLISVNSAHTLGVGRVALGVYSDGSLDQSYLEKREAFSRVDSIYITDNPNPAISTFNIQPFIGAGLADFFDVSLMLPIHLDMVGRFQETGIGDLRASFKLNARAAKSTPVFDLGFLGALVFGTGTDQKGFFPRHLYYFNKDSLSVNSGILNGFYTARGTTFETHMLLTLDLSPLAFSIPLAFHLDGGMLFCTAPDADNALLMSGGIEYHPVRLLALTAEFNSEMRMANVTNGFRPNHDPLTVSPALMLTPQNGIMLTGGCDFSLSAPSVTFTYKKPGELSPQRITSGIEPHWRVFAGIGWNGMFIDRDRDGDGVFDRGDKCISKKEDVDGFEDEDGCPDPDNDKDGIPDSLDKCPNNLEDKDGFEDNEGCPDYDNDGDKIADSVDKCPTVPEDFDGVQDNDGCPDYDNDGDMVPDSIDKCPNIPEDIDGYKDDDGCPDVDNDQDGVPDSLDKCPDQIGPPENAGCAIKESPKVKPRAREIKRGRVILRGVSFQTGTSTIDPTSYIILDEVVASLNDWPEVTLEIQGHTEKSGKMDEMVLLSQARAETVRNYLINRGIAPHRIVAVGKGWSDPIADTATAQGRAMNNRIELRRTDPE